MNLSETYARVCAVRPELAVDGLRYEETPHWKDTVPMGWFRNGNPATDEAADKAILARWVEALPVGFVLYQRTPNVWECDWINDIWYEGDPPKHIGPTPLEALAAFYLGEAT